MPVIADWCNILMEKEETKHLAVVLTRYVTGSAATMGGHTNIDMDNSYIVIDLTDLPDDLMLASLYAATRFRRGEGLLCIGHNHVPIGVHVSPKEYEAITTSPTDLRARLEG